MKSCWSREAPMHPLQGPKPELLKVRNVSESPFLVRKLLRAVVYSRQMRLLRCGMKKLEIPSWGVRWEGDHFQVGLGHFPCFSFLPGNSALSCSLTQARSQLLGQISRRPLGPHRAALSGRRQRRRGGGCVRAAPAGVWTRTFSGPLHELP